MEELVRPKALSKEQGAVRLGVFLPNEHANSFTTSGPRLTDSTYESIRNVTCLADEVGLAFALTVARWKGVPGESTGYAMYGFDTFTLAGALLEATEKITIISTAHSIVWNPVIAAKLGADLDQIGGGRWGLNIVAGWSEDEFGSMGISLSSREQRYEQAIHWLAAVRELWLAGNSSYACEFFALNDAECHPRPLQQGGPLIVNAGSSPTGMRFAVESADYLFSSGTNAEQFRQVREELKSDVGYIGSKRVIVAKTHAEAEEQAQEILDGWDILGQARREVMMGRLEQPSGPNLDQKLRALLPSDKSELRTRLLKDVVIGTPDTIAEQLAKWALSTGVDGICLTFYDFEASLELLAGRSFEQLGNALADGGKRLLLT